MEVTRRVPSVPCDVMLRCVVAKRRIAIMKAPCSLRRLRNGNWSVHHSSPGLGSVEVSASGREEALTKMRNELQYRIEWCPCSGVSGDTVELQVSEESGTSN